MSYGNSRGGLESCRGMERAILTMGEEKGLFKGIKKSNGDFYKMERDTEKPIRLTVQFYMCSDTEKISDSNVEDIVNQIRHIYDQGLNEGSLVVDHNTNRPGVFTKTVPERPTATTTHVPYFLDNSIL